LGGRLQTLNFFEECLQIAFNSRPNRRIINDIVSVNEDVPEADYLFRIRDLFQGLWILIPNPDQSFANYGELVFDCRLDEFVLAVIL
jgi:hypothetical protein